MSMSNISEKSEEFEGIYVAPEAALYLTATIQRDVPEPVIIYRPNSRRILSWIRAGLTSPSLMDVPGKELVMTFEDLISLRVVTVMRAFGLSWRKIHQAEHWLRQQTGYARPFAIQRVWTETVDVFAELPIGLVTASRQGQMAFPELLGEYLQPVEDLTFVPHDGVRVADTWFPHKEVLIDPTVQFGEPCVQNTRTPTRMLWRMWNGGDSIFYLSHAFQLKESQVEHALEWEGRLQVAKGHSLPR